MKLLVLGATGGTGGHVVSQALDAGHDVTAYVRDPSRMQSRHVRLGTVQGALDDVPRLTDAMRGQDAVISAIGRGLSFKSEHLMARAVPQVLAAMTAAGTRRLIFTSAFGVGASYRDSPILARLFFRTLLRGIYADKAVGDDAIRRSDREWTVVQPSQMTDGPLTGSYRSGERLVMSGMPQISRADAAHFILRCAGDPDTVRKTLIVSY